MYRFLDVSPSIYRMLHKVPRLFRKMNISLYSTECPLQKELAHFCAFLFKLRETPPASGWRRPGGQTERVASDVDRPNRHSFTRSVVVARRIAA